MYRPPTRFHVPMYLLTPTVRRVSGVPQKTYPDTGPLFYGSFRTFGGTESTENGLYSLKNTAVIDTWYRPDLKGDCQIKLAETEEVYDIIGEPEDIDRRHQYLKFRVEAVKGGA